MIAPSRSAFQPALSSSTNTRSGAIRAQGGSASSKATALALVGTSTNQPKATEASTTQHWDSALVTALTDQIVDSQLAPKSWGLLSQLG